MGLLLSAFRPETGKTVNLAVTTTTANVAIWSPAAPTNAEPVVRVYNAGANTAWVEFGVSTVTATSAASMPVASGTSILVRLDNTQTYGAAITSTSTATVYFTPGYGAP